MKGQLNDVNSTSQFAYAPILAAEAKEGQESHVALTFCCARGVLQEKDVRLCT